MADVSSRVAKSQPLVVLAANPYVWVRVTKEEITLPGSAVKAESTT